MRLHGVDVGSRSKLFSNALAIVVRRGTHLRTLIGGLHAIGKIGRMGEGWMWGRELLELPEFVMGP